MFNLLRKRKQNESVFGRIDDENRQLIFFIIFRVKICVKIIPNLEKNTIQVKNMCYNIVGKKRKGVLCSECKYSSLKAFSSFCPNRMGQQKNYC
jgi:hypothetical protein